MCAYGLLYLIIDLLNLHLSYFKKILINQSRLIKILTVLLWLKKKLTTIVVPTKGDSCVMFCFELLSNKNNFNPILANANQ